MINIIVSGPIFRFLLAEDLTLGNYLKSLNVTVIYMCETLGMPCCHIIFSLFFREPCARMTSYRKSQCDTAKVCSELQVLKWLSVLFFVQAGYRANYFKTHFAINCNKVYDMFYLLVHGWHSLLTARFLMKLYYKWSKKLGNTLPQKIRT